MSVTQDILASYRNPGAVVRRRLADGVREDRALVIVMLGCVLMFVAQWPRLARDSFVDGGDLQMRLGGALLGLVFIAPLLLYVLAAGVHLLARLFGGAGSGYATRYALFWALLASSPLVLLHGLVAGFVGPGVGLTCVGVVWLIAFVVFLVSGLRSAHRASAPVA